LADDFNNAEDTMARILIVDDSKITVITTKKILTKNGHEVDGVLNAKKALELISVRFYDIVFLDVNMPNVDGLTMLDQISGLELDHDPAVCMLSADSGHSTIIDSIQRGAMDYLLKPVDQQILLTKVNELLGQDVDKEYPSVNILHSEAAILESRVIPEIEVLWLSELQINFKSSAEFLEDSVHRIRIPLIQKELGLHSDTYIIKILSSDMTDFGQHDISGEFLGMVEFDQSKIRSWAIKRKSLAR
jgi:two-component system, chemotaxis family, chemotaxis protein CheY